MSNCKNDHMILTIKGNEIGRRVSYCPARSTVAFGSYFFIAADCIHYYGDRKCDMPGLLLAQSQCFLHVVARCGSDVLLLSHFKTFALFCFLSREQVSF